LVLSITKTYYFYSKSVLRGTAGQQACSVIMFYEAVGFFMNGSPDGRTLKTAVSQR